MRRVTKWLLRLLAAAAALIVLVATAVVIVMNTERGTRWALEQAAQAIPGELVFSEFRGTLWRGLRFAELGYSTDGQRMTAAGVEVNINWPASALGYLRLSHFRAASLVIELAGSGEEPAAALAVPPTPVTVFVRTIELGELRLPSDARETVIRDIRLRAVRYEESTVSLDSLRLQFEDLALRATDVSLGLTGDGPLRADIDYATYEAATTYGILGVKVWIFKGEKFDRPEAAADKAEQQAS